MDICMKKENVTVTAEDYAKKFLSAIKKAEADDNIVSIINKIYGEGFEDGYEARKNESNKEEE